MADAVLEMPSGGWGSVDADTIFRNGDKHKKQCAYCPTIGKNTLEHVSPKWILKSSRDVIRPGYTNLRTINGRKGGSDVQFKKTKCGNHILSSTIRKLCSDCNGVWSKQIVDAAMPVIKGARAGVPIAGCDAIALAQQAILFFMNREFLDSKNQVSSYRVRREFRMCVGIPKGFRVWAALNRTDVYRFEWNQFSRFAYIKPYEAEVMVPADGFGRAIFAMGNVVFYVELVERYIASSNAGFWHTDAVPGFCSLNGSGEILLDICDDRTFEQCAWVSIPEKEKEKFIPLGRNKNSWE